MTLLESCSMLPRSALDMGRVISEIGDWRDASHYKGGQGDIARLARVILAEPYGSYTNEQLGTEIVWRLRGESYSTIDRTREALIRDLRTLDSRGVVD